MLESILGASLGEQIRQVGSVPSSGIGSVLESYVEK